MLVSKEIFSQYNAIRQTTWVKNHLHFVFYINSIPPSIICVSKSCRVEVAAKVMAKPNDLTAYRFWLSCRVKNCHP